MNKYIYVTTYPENGWDCVGDVYKAESEEDVYKHIAKEKGVDVDDEELRNTVIVHQQYDIIKL